MAARHCGIKCFAVSLITNKCNPTYDEVSDVNHEEVMECGRVRGKVSLSEFVKFVSTNHIS